MRQWFKRRPFSHQHLTNTTAAAHGRLVRKPTSRTLSTWYGNKWSYKEFFRQARQEFNQSDYGARKLGIRHSYAPALFQFGPGLLQPSACSISLMKVTLGIPVILSHSSKPDFKAVLEANIHCSVQWGFFFSSPTPQLNFTLTDTNCPNVHFAVEVQLFSASESFGEKDSPHNIVSYFLFSNFFAVHIVKISP